MMMMMPGFLDPRGLVTQTHAATVFIYRARVRGCLYVSMGVRSRRIDSPSKGLCRFAVAKSERSFMWALHPALSFTAATTPTTTHTAPQTSPPPGDNDHNPFFVYCAWHARC